MRTHWREPDGRSVSTTAPSELLQGACPYGKGGLAEHGGATFEVTDVYVGMKGVTIVECERHVEAPDD